MSSNTNTSRTYESQTLWRINTRSPFGFLLRSRTVHRQERELGDYFRDLSSLLFINLTAAVIRWADLLFRVFMFCKVDGPTGAAGETHCTSWTLQRREGEKKRENRSFWWGRLWIHWELSRILSCLFCRIPYRATKRNAPVPWVPFSVSEHCWKHLGQCKFITQQHI